MMRGDEQVRMSIQDLKHRQNKLSLIDDIKLQFINPNFEAKFVELILLSGTDVMIFCYTLE